MSSDVDRRDFLKVAGCGAVAVTSTAARFPFLQQGISHAELIPEKKGLSADWIQSLTLRGTPNILSGDDRKTIRMPVGGIGTGQLYLRADGSLTSWKIFNHIPFSGFGQTNYIHKRPFHKPEVDHGFAILVDGKAHRLNLEEFPELTFRGTYPIGTVQYDKKDIPVSVTLDAFSPFIPLNENDSGLPATLMEFTVKNPSENEIEIRMLGWLENAVLHMNSQRDIHALKKTVLMEIDGNGLVRHSAVAIEKKIKDANTIVFEDFEGADFSNWTTEETAFGKGPVQTKKNGVEGKGWARSSTGGDSATGVLVSREFTIEREYINFKIGGAWGAFRHAMTLEVEDKNVKRTTGGNGDKLEWKAWDVKPWMGKKARIRIWDKGKEGQTHVDHIEFSDHRRTRPPGPADTLPDFGSMALAMVGELPPSEEMETVIRSLPGDLGKLNCASEEFLVEKKQSSALLTRERKLGPGESRRFIFILAWHFPNHGPGHHYVELFPTITGLVAYLQKHHNRLSLETRLWVETYYNSTLPYWLLDRIHSTVSTLATGTCQWRKGGRFWAFEGVGCCHGTCTHVWNYAHALGRLFPKLEQSVREMQDLGVAFYPDGLIGFRDDWKRPAMDGQAGTILKCYREHQMSPDNLFLKKYWPKIKKALAFLIGQDGNRDGLIEGVQHNTFDIDFHGANTFVGSLYLGALRAGAEMAREMEEPETVQTLIALSKSGAALSKKRLWNGEYFKQEVDLKKFPKHQYGDGCISDQLFGQGWAHQVGLGYLYAKDDIRQSLSSVWKYNWTPDIDAYNKIHKPKRPFAEKGEKGLFTCTWPKSPHLSEGLLYKNEVWTGIEYQVAGHMIWEGMTTEGLAIVRGIDERYDAKKRNPYNEIECGDHYARGMASWGVFTALSGFEVHGPRRHLGFAPRITPEHFRAAFTAAEGWGTFSQTRADGIQEIRIEMKWGSLRLKTLSLELPGETLRSVNATLGKEEKNINHALQGAKLLLSFPAEVSLSLDKPLVISLRT